MGRQLAHDLASFEGDLVSTRDAARLVEAAEIVVRHASALRTLAARRAAQGNVWREDGRFATPGEWLAATTGAAVGDATRALQAAEALADLSDVADSFRHGELSLAQAETIADAAAHDPGAQAELLDAATKVTFRQLKGLCRKIKDRAHSVEDDAARAARQHRLRRANCWVDDDGLGSLTAKLPPDKMAVLWGTVQAEADRLFDEARAETRREPVGSYRADALFNLVVAGAGGPAGAATTGRAPRMLIRVDLAALQRGYAGDDEVCDIPGIGAIPVATARRLLPDSLLSVLVSDGVDIRTVVSVRRHVPAAVDLALRWRDPCCVVPGCDRSTHLERDHWQVDFADSGPTSLDNLCRMCRPHHRDKTLRGAVLSGGPGRWRWKPPLPASNGPDP